MRPRAARSRDRAVADAAALRALRASARPRAACAGCIAALGMLAVLAVATIARVARRRARRRRRRPRRLDRAAGRTLAPSSYVAHDRSRRPSPQLRHDVPGRRASCSAATRLARPAWSRTVLLVETERDGLVLVDTGFGTRDIEGTTGLSRVVQRCSRPALDPARDRGRAGRARSASIADDVRHIVVTHLDLDHAGGLADFPHAKVHLHAREHAAAMARTTLQGARALPEGALGARPEVGGLHRGRRHAGAACPRSRGCAASTPTSASCRCTATRAVTPR